MRVLFVLFLPFLACGCYRPYIVREALKAEEIVELSSSGKTPEEIIQRIDETGTIYLLDTEDIIELHEEGVDTRVIEYMRRTREIDLERRARYHYQHGYYHHYPFIGIGFSGSYCW